MARKRVLITGAAGFIGSYIRQNYGDRYIMRLADITEIDNPGGHEVMKADIADLDQMQRACEGMDTVVHLAADRSPSADFYETLLSLNIIGTYNVFQAAKDQGCERVVFASSINAMLAYPPGPLRHLGYAGQPTQRLRRDQMLRRIVRTLFRTRRAILNRNPNRRN